MENIRIIRFWVAAFTILAAACSIGSGVTNLAAAFTILAAVFFATSFGLAVIAKQKAALPVNDLMSGLEAAEQVESQPAVDVAAEIQESFDDLPDFDSVAPASSDIIDSIPE